MRRFLLLISAMLVMSGIIAQDIYTSGYYFVDGHRNSAVYKNGTYLYGASGSSSYWHYSSAVVVSSTNDVYWADNCADATALTNYNYGDVFKNGNRWLSNPTGSGSQIFALWRSSNNYIFSAGCKDVNGVRTAVMWRNDETTPYYTLGDGVYPSIALCGVFVGSYSYIGGFQQTSATASSRHGVVWYQGSPYYTYPDGTDIRGIAYYDGAIYCCGTASEGGTSKLKVWRNGDVLYTLLDSDASTESKIYVESGDVYVSASNGNGYTIWKNGEELYSTTSSTAGNYRTVIANTDGVYYAGAYNGVAAVWKDGQILYSQDECTIFTEIYVPEPQCENSDIRTLPFNEGFENGETEWNCWTKVNTDGSGSFSTWERSGTGTSVPPCTGNYCARHGYNGSTEQEGWLISPRIFLQPGRDNTTLTFKTYEQYANDMQYEGVWISTSSTSTSAFTEVWTQESASAEWKTVNVDLKPYQGQDVYIAFKYAGLNGHNWYIDDVNLTESWTPAGTSSVPYYQNFAQATNQEPGYCWYILDNDHSGEAKNWKWNENESCAYHPWGQQNKPQEGWMMSPSVDLESNHNYMLSFRTKNGSSGPDMKSSVWIALDETGVPNPANYTTQLWEETVENSWHNINIDLSDYAGHVVRIGFKYEGTYAHNWYVDDFAIEENIIQYNINVEANNASWGSVTGGGIYDQGENVTITAEANDGYIFLQWTKDGNIVSDETSYSFTATEDATYVAVFGEPAVNYYTITTDLSPIEAGWIDGAGIYAEGETVTLTAYTNMGWIFDEWSDGNTDNPRTITVTGDATYIGIFSQMTFSINVSAEPAEGGTVEGTGTYPYGEYVVLRAHAAEGYYFLNWNDGNTDDERVIIVDGDADYIAYFAQEGVTTYTVTVLANDPDLGYVTGGGTFPEGTDISISATPIGYANFINWSDGSTKATRTITVTEDATYIANFEMGQLYTITVLSQDPTMGTVLGGGEFPAGAEIIIQATAFGGYYFDGWTDGVYDNPRTVTVTGAATYTAKFSAQQTQTYALNVQCNPMHGYVEGGGIYQEGTEVTVKATAYQGYVFERWEDGVTENPRIVTMTSNITLVALFKGDAIDENGTQGISIYPNPANDVIRLEGLDGNNEVRIYNTIGSLVKVVNVNDNEEIHVSELSAGVYIIRTGNAVIRFTKE